MSDKDPVVEQVEKGLAGVRDQVDSKVKELTSDIEAMSEKMDAQAKTSGEIAEDLKNQYKNAEEQLKALKERQDAFETTANRMNGKSADKSFQANIHKALEDNMEGIKAFAGGQTTAMKFDMKAVMTEAADWTDDVVEPTRVPGIKFDPERRNRVRQYIPTGTTDSNSIAYIQETAYSDGTDVSA